MLDILSDILLRLSIQGTLYFRTACTHPWGVAVPAFENVARFHYADRGDCMVRIRKTGKTFRLSQGDLVIIPHGAAHDLYGGREEGETILPLDRVLELSGYSGEGVLVYGGNAGSKKAEQKRETQLICGHFSFAPGARHLVYDRLPDHVHIANYGEDAGRWMEASLRMIGDEAGRARIGGDLISLRMSEVIFTQALRTFIEQQGTRHVGLAGFADTHLGRALSAFHKAPANNWSVETLAREAGMSRTGFAVHFSSRMGLTPMQYLTSWRMQIARSELSDERASVADVAARVGYASESAFSRVFKKEVGETPAAYRAASAR